MTLKEAIQNGELKAAEVAEICGVTRQTVYNWLTGRQHIRLKDALAIRAMCNNSIELENMVN